MDTLETLDTFMEGLLEVQIRERRFQIWNKIQTLYIIPDYIQKAVQRWIDNDCNNIPKIMSSPSAHVVPREDTSVSHRR
jgi:hypothetical protein